MNGYVFDCVCYLNSFESICITDKVQAQRKSLEYHQFPLLVFLPSLLFFLNGHFSFSLFSSLDSNPKPLAKWARWRCTCLTNVWGVAGSGAIHLRARSSPYPPADAPREIRFSHILWLRLAVGDIHKGK